ncbi:MAG TPA: SPOR domain-containing protein [Candidatus Binatia bacterium]|nr:SPOR domain-containing protein [Candidatus Binatia bacterium]
MSRIGVWVSGFFWLGAAHAQALQVVSGPGELLRGDVSAALTPGASMAAGDDLRSADAIVELRSDQGRWQLAPASEMILEQASAVPGSLVGVRLMRGRLRVQPAAHQAAETRLDDHVLALAPGDYTFQRLDGAWQACVLRGQATLGTFRGVVRGTLPARGCYRIRGDSVAPMRSADANESIAVFGGDAEAPASAGAPSPMSSTTTASSPAPAPVSASEPAGVWDPRMNRRIVGDAPARSADLAEPAGTAPAPGETAPAPKSYWQQDVAPAPPVLSPAPAAAPRDTETASTQPASSGHWWVNVGSFRDRASAEREAARPELSGQRPRIAENSVRGVPWYRVQVGGFDSQSQALAVAARLAEALGNPSVWVLTSP